MIAPGHSASLEKTWFFPWCIFILDCLGNFKSTQVSDQWKCILCLNFVWFFRRVYSLISPVYRLDFLSLLYLDSPVLLHNPFLQAFFKHPAWATASQNRENKQWLLPTFTQISDILHASNSVPFPAWWEPKHSLPPRILVTMRLMSLKKMASFWSLSRHVWSYHC